MHHIIAFCLLATSSAAYYRPTSHGEWTKGSTTKADSLLVSLTSKLAQSSSLVGTYSPPHAQHYQWDQRNSILCKKLTHAFQLLTVHIWPSRTQNRSSNLQISMSINEAARTIFSLHDLTVHHHITAMNIRRRLEFICKVTRKIFSSKISGIYCRQMKRSKSCFLH